MGNYISKIFGASPVGPIQDHMDTCYRCSRELVTWTSKDGAAIEGVLWKPADYDPAQQYPLLVEIHGGPTATSRPSLVASYVYPHVHWLAKGAVVLQPNYRGSGGYGRRFRELGHGEWGVGIEDDIDAALEHILTLDAIDPGRMAISGASYGGHAPAFAPP